MKLRPNHHEKTFWTLRSKNRMMIELIQEVLASEDGDDIDWDSWDARAKEVLRANNVTIFERQKQRIQEQRNKEAESAERREQEKFTKGAALAESLRAEIDRAMNAKDNAPETSVYVRSLIKSAERRKQALSARNAAP